MCQSNYFRLSNHRDHHSFTKPSTLSIFAPFNSELTTSMPKKQSVVLGILAAILLAFINITTIILVCAVPEINYPLDTSFRETAFKLMSESINYQVSTCLTCLFHQKNPSGLFGDYQVYHDVIQNSTFVKLPNLDTPPSKVQMYMEQTTVDYPSVVNQSFWLMVNLEYLSNQLKKTDPPVTMVFVKTRKQAELLANY